MRIWTKSTIALQPNGKYTAKRLLIYHGCAIVCGRNLATFFEIMTLNVLFVLISLIIVLALVLVLGGQNVARAVSDA